VCGWCADLATRAATDSTIDKQPTPARDGHLVIGTARPAQCPQPRVPLIFDAVVISHLPVHNIGE